MGCYVIAIGGTGNKILESIVYAACADAFCTADGEPLNMLDMLSVDVDAACGNTTRAKRAAEFYEEVRGVFAASPYRHHGFHTQVNVDRWSMNLSKRASSVQQMSRGSTRDQLLARALFSETEARLEYSEGFRGHPDLGVLFFAEMLDGLEEARREGLPDELNALIDRMDRDIAAGRTVRLILCGSIFGGTGASGIPALSKYFHARYAGKREHFIMGSMLMLPYYSVPPANVDEQQEIAVNSDEFLDKARTALQYYGMESMIRSSDTDPNGVYDAVYLLGLPPEYFVTTRIYSTGSQSQENDAHMLEWLAARCVAQFMRTGFRGADAHNIDCYYYQWHTPCFAWASFDEDAALYQARYGGLIKSAAVFFSECHPTLRKRIVRNSRRAGRVSYAAPYFHRRFSTAQRTQLESRLDALYQFWAFYVNWFHQVLSSLPAPMREADGQNGLLDEKALESLMRVLKDPKSRSACEAVQRTVDRLVKSAVQDRRDLNAILRRMGGAECDPRTPDAALAAFITALMNAVYE